MIYFYGPTIIYFMGTGIISPVKRNPWRLKIFRFQMKYKRFSCERLLTLASYNVQTSPNLPWGLSFIDPPFGTTFGLWFSHNELRRSSIVYTRCGSAQPEVRALRCEADSPAKRWVTWLWNVGQTETGSPGSSRAVTGVHRSEYLVVSGWRIDTVR